MKHWQAPLLFLSLSSVCVLWFGYNVNKIHQEMMLFNEQMDQFEEIFELSVRVGE